MYHTPINKLYNDNSDIPRTGILHKDTLAFDKNFDTTKINAVSNKKTDKRLNGRRFNVVGTEKFWRAVIGRMCAENWKNADVDEKT